MSKSICNDQILARFGDLHPWWPFVGALLVLLATCWVSTGTLAPYAATLAAPLELPCGYLANIDHPFHFQPFLMLQGAPPETWQSAMLLRRILYPLLAWPLVAMLGFDVGGLLTNILLTVVAFFVWVLFIRQKTGRFGAITSAWLLATYPGIAYWVGMPYSYAVIVPFMLIGTVLLWTLAEGPCSWLKVFLLNSGIGLLLTAYDGLLTFLIPAILWILWRQRRVNQIPLAMVGVVWPLLTTLAILHWGMGASLSNSNSQTYWFILESWIHMTFSWQDGWDKLANLPQLAAKMYFFSNFFLLPLVFLVFFLLLKRYHGVRPHVVEEGILGATALFFLFLNLAPAYPGWQMRGEWIARCFQPVFVVFVLHISRSMGKSAAAWSSFRWLAVALVGITVLGNGWIVFGGLHGSRITDLAYRNFYQHAEPLRYSYNLERHGTRPWGFCRNASP